MQNALRINSGIENSLGMAKERIHFTCLHEPVDAQRGQETSALSHPHCSALEFTSKNQYMETEKGQEGHGAGKNTQNQVVWG